MLEHLIDALLIAAPISPLTIALASDSAGVPSLMNTLRFLS
jgi:hypothetical protein